MTLTFMGREIEDPTTIVALDAYIVVGQTSVVDFNKAERKYVFIDDNHSPCKLTTLDMPCKSYYKDPKWLDCEITNIIVPLHSKVYMDSAKASSIQRILTKQQVKKNPLDPLFGADCKLG